MSVEDLGVLVVSDAVTVAYLHPEQVAQSWANSWMRLFAHDVSPLEGHAGGGKLRIARGGYIAINADTGGIVEARNKVVRMFLDGHPDSDWLLWIDADMGFQPDALERLLEAADATTRPIVGALCFGYKNVGDDGYSGQTRRAFPTVFDYAEQDGERGFRPRYNYIPGEVQQCAGTGSAFILIHRNVLEAIADTDTGGWYDRIQLSPKMLLGEDLSFCVRASAAGYPIHVHAGVRTTHLKETWVGEPDYFEVLGVPLATETVAVLVPVMQRPHNAAPFMASLRATTGLATVYAITDADDSPTRTAWEEAGATVLTASDGSTFAHKVNQGARDTTEPWVFLCGDDVRFRRGWLDHTQWIASSGAHVIGTNDLANPRVVNGTHATHMLIRRSYITEQGASWDGPGVVAHAGYHHWYVDDEIVTAAKQRGCWAMALGAIVEHQHPITGAVPMDDVYILGQSHAAADGRLFKKRLAKQLGGQR